MTDRSSLAKIHIARKDLGLQEETYRDLLLKVAGVDSASRLDTAGIAKVLAEFGRLGWRPAVKRKASSKPYVRLIFGLWSELGRRGVVANVARPALLAFVQRQTGISDPEWLSASEAAKVIEALKAMRDRA